MSFNQSPAVSLVGRQALHHSEERISAMAMDLEGYTNEAGGGMGWFSGAVAMVDRCVFVLRTSQLTNSYSIFLTLKYSNWLCWDEFVVSVYLMFEDVIECIIEEDVLHVLIGLLDDFF
jgi:hypothetical protein